jgi:hypothetical protein
VKDRAKIYVQKREKEMTIEQYRKIIEIEVENDGGTR